MPGFHDVNDARAVATIQAALPDRKVVQVPCCGRRLLWWCRDGRDASSLPSHVTPANAQVYSREIILGGGNIHCITQQQPVPPLTL